MEHSLTCPSVWGEAKGNCALRPQAVSQALSPYRETTV